METKFELREIEFDDIFRVVRIVDSLGVLNEMSKLASLFEQPSENETEEEKEAREKRSHELGMTLAGILAAGLGQEKAAKEVKGFLASLAGIKLSKLERLGADDTISLLEQIKEERGKDLIDFFGKAFKLATGGLG